MSDLTFRTKTEPQVEAPKEAQKPTNKEIVVGGGEEKEMSPELWSNTTGKPYLAKLLDLVNVFDDLPHEVISDIEFIEDYFKEFVRKGKRTNDSVSYKDFLSYLERITNSKNLPITQKLNTIASFIKTIKRAKEYVKSS